MFWLTVIMFVIFLLIIIPTIVKLYRQEEPQLAKNVTRTSLCFSLLFLCILFFRLEVPYWVILLGMTAAFISGFCGQNLRMYYRSIVFDRYLHAYGSFVYAILFFYLLDHFLMMGGSPVFLALFVFLLGNTLGVIFELMEFWHDLKPTNTIKGQHSLKDTDTDMLFNLFGAIGAAVFVFFTV